MLEPTTLTAIAIAASPERELDPEEIFGEMEEDNADDLEDIDSVADTKKCRHKSPVKSRWLVPLVKFAIAEKPNISNKDKDMVSLLKPYVNDNFLTDSLFQMTRVSVREIVFGDPNENVQLLNEFYKSLESLGHGDEIITATQREVITKLEEIVLTERLQKAKRHGEKTKRDQKIQFVKDWQVKHHGMIVEGGLLLLDGLHKFVSGIFMCTSAVKQTTPLLQTVYQADAAHMNFGKSTLYSCYGITANCNAYPVAFGIVS